MAEQPGRPTRQVMRFLALLLLALLIGGLIAQGLTSRHGRNQPTIDDRWIVVKLRLQYNFALSLHRELEVSSRHGLVTLSGSVQTQQDRERAVAIAKNTAGVTGVINLLSVTRPAPAAAPH